MSEAFSSVSYHSVHDNGSENDADSESDTAVMNNKTLEKGKTIEGGNTLENENEDLEKASNNGGLCSSWHATWNLVNMIEGTGVLGLPFAVKEGGIVVIFGLLFLAIISNYTGQILIGCLYSTPKESAKKEENAELVKSEEVRDDEDTGARRVRSTYEAIGEECFPYFGGKIVIVIQIIELVSVSTLYLVLSGTLLVHTFPSLPITHRGWIALSAMFVLPTVFLKSLAHVAWLSFVSTVALLVTVIAVIWYGISVRTQWDIGSITSCNIETVPVGMGIVLFSYAAHPLLPGIEQSLKDKTKFPIIMNASFVFAAISKVLFSVMAYFAFGDKTMEVVTNNLPRGAVQTTACVLLTLNVLFSYAFPMFTVIQCVTDSVVSRCCVPDPATMLFTITLRFTLVTMTMLSALLIPHFALLMSFIGNFTGACLVFVFPAVFHLILRKGELKYWKIALDIIIIVFGVSTGLIGIVYSGKALIHVYTS